MKALIRNWWMMAVRGILAASFGLSILLWPGMTLWTIVVLFGAYAMLDGLWAIASVLTAWRRSPAWPVAAQGLASVTFGFLALGWPFLPREVVYLLAGWGILTGALEIVTATWLPKAVAAHWLLGTAGVFSLFLAGLILMLPYADAAQVARLLGSYGVAFGVLVTLVAAAFRRAHAAWRERPRAA